MDAQDAAKLLNTLAHARQSHSPCHLGIFLLKTNTVVRNPHDGFVIFTSNCNANMGGK
jgi:hypothetical protein